MFIAAVVPAFNEQESVAEVARAAASHVDFVIVVDDGSTDATSARAAEAGAIVVRHEVNRGVGAAIATGLAEARSRGADAIIQVDGDGQHEVADIPRVLAQLAQGHDFVVGTRFEQGFEMGSTRRTVLRLFAWAIERRIGVRVTDPTSGFRAYSAHAADSLAPRFPRKYLSDTVEVLFLANEAGLSISTVPVSMHQRQGGESSVGPLRGVVFTLRMLGIVIGHSVRRSGRRHDA